MVAALIFYVRKWHESYILTTFHINLIESIIDDIERWSPMFIRSNLNPNYERVGDCVIRAISKVLEQSWDKTYIDLAVLGLRMKDMMSSNVVWSTYLHDKGFNRYSIPNSCPDCYTISDFAKDHPYGTYIVATGKHVVAVMGGCFFDTWDCGEEVAIYYFVKEREGNRWQYSMEDTLSRILKRDINR